MPKAESLDRLAAQSRRRTGTFGVVDTSAGGAAQMATGNLTYIIYIYIYGYGSIPINTIFRGMNIHLPAILMFTRGTRLWHTAIYTLIYIYIYIANGDL